jgi:hypothetical protein
MKRQINFEKVANIALQYALIKSAGRGSTSSPQTSTVAAATSPAFKATGARTIPATSPVFDWRHALLGAGVGAGAGALSGLFAPGKDDEDEKDVTGSSVWRGLLGGGLGGVAGGFGGKYVSPYVSPALSELAQRYKEIGYDMGAEGLHRNSPPSSYPDNQAWRVFRNPTVKGSD